MARTNAWSVKVLALLKAGNEAAAIAQIAVAPSVKDLKALQTALATAQAGGRRPAVDTAIDDSIAAMSAPRLHRSP